MKTEKQKSEKSAKSGMGATKKKAAKVSVRKAAPKRKQLKSKKSDMNLSQSLVSVMPAKTQEVQKHIDKLFPKPLEFEFILALLLLVITQMSLIIAQ